jgi:hypothetical protein
LLQVSSKQTVHPRAVPWLSAGAILFGIGVLVGLWYQPYPELIATVFSENGPVETLEMVALTSAAALFILRAARSNDPIGTMCIPIAVALASALVRETPRCDSSFYDGGMCFPDRLWKHVIIGSFLTLAAIALFIRRRHFFAVFSIQRIHVFWPIWISALLLVIAEISEKYGAMGTEELVEFFAYLYLACFGVWMHRNT